MERRALYYEPDDEERRRRIAHPARSAHFVNKRPIHVQELAIVDQNSPESTFSLEHAVIPPDRDLEQPVDQVTPHDLSYQYRDLNRGLSVTTRGTGSCQ